ncbi:hypothetical protein [Desulfosediminicola ganghwensis]|uniref:hypothetical protein n=1 Tax=Desulfosediminicola ganghwensis TaxID=2569540 RepID=UPI0010AC5423|nr:hypothetical protein [Desulfosediminicola ganghwensis]
MAAKPTSNKQARISAGKTLKHGQAKPPNGVTGIGQVLEKRLEEISVDFLCAVVSASQPGLKVR